MPPRNRRQQTTSASPTVVQQPAAAEGWEVGNVAPGDKYAPLDTGTGQPKLDKLSDKPVKGYGVQVVAKGDVISQAVYDQLNPDQASTPEVVQTPVPEPQGDGQTEPPKQ